MCGFVGFLNNRGFEHDFASRLIRRMATTLSHRGPDSGNHWVDATAGIALGHRRLSILDLSEAGAQPMASPSGRFVIALNGEVYNHLDIRKQLRHDSVSWRGTSDTETLVAAIEAWGLRRAVQESVGMFAFAVWDTQLQKLSLVRDRLGEKPLYYGYQGNTLIFGSELKAIERHPDFRFEISNEAVRAYLKLCYVPTPLSIWNGIHKLEPGSILTIDPNLADTSPPSPERYWSLFETISTKPDTSLTMLSDKDRIDCLDDLLKNTIRQQLVADVPVGAFLSGGIDSSIVVALMQSVCSNQINTFSIGFDEAKYNEAPFAKKVAAHLGTAHTEMYVSSADALNVIPLLPKIYDEPFADSSQIPTYMVSALARRSVTVVLSGDGGDESFCGYSRYQYAAKKILRIANVPLLFRRWLGRTIHLATRSHATHSRCWEGLLKLASILSKKSEAEMYLDFVARTHRDYTIDEQPTGTLFNRRLDPLRRQELIETMMYIDSQTYLPDDIMTKVDRATMAVSLEARAPFLDHRLIEFSWKLPFDAKLRNGETKWILRRLLERYVPKAFFDRPKTGFAVPLGRWLRSEIRPWAESLISKKQMLVDLGLNVRLVTQAWDEHQRGRKDQSTVLWNVLMLAAWREEVIARRNFDGNESVIRA